MKKSNDIPQLLEQMYRAQILLAACAGLQPPQILALFQQGKTTVPANHYAAVDAVEQAHQQATVEVRAWAGTTRMANNHLLERATTTAEEKADLYELLYRYLGYLARRLRYLESKVPRVARERALPVIHPKFTP